VTPSRVRVTVRVEVLEPVNGSSSFERVSTSAQLADEVLVRVQHDPTRDRRDLLLHAITGAAEDAAERASTGAFAAVIAADPLRGEL